MGDGCISKKSELEEEWSIDISVSGTLAKCSDVQYADATFRNISDQHHWLESPLMKQIALWFLYCSSGLWAFFQAVILLTYVVVTKIFSYDKLDPRHIIHVLGFITPNFLNICLMIMAALAIFQAWILVRVGIGKFLFVYVLKTFLPWKLHVLGACLHLGDCLLHCVSLTDWIL
jgi:hypothetical protein